MPPQKQQNQQRRGDLRLKQCPFCDHGAKYIDYKDYPTLKTYVDYFGNIRNRYYTGVCLKHQSGMRADVAGRR